MDNKISKFAVVQTNFIGKNVTIGEFCVIRENVVIGDYVFIHPNVVINSGVVLKEGIEVFPGAYIGKEPKGAGAVSRKEDFNKKVIIGQNCVIGPGSVIYYDVEIGPNTLIGDGANVREKTVIGEFCVIGRGVTVYYNANIGNRTKIMDNTNITGNCKIGCDVFISALVATTNDNKLGKLGYSKKHVVGPVIKDRAAIGAGANILPGIVIEEDVVVAASALVTKDVPKGKLVMGIPARIVGDVAVENK